MATREDIMDDARNEEREELEDWLRDREELEAWVERNREWELAVSGR